MQNTVSEVAWEYLAVCVPIVVICAPFGSLMASHFHRLTLASFVYVLELVALISGFVIVKPDWQLGLVSGAILIGGFVFFFILSKVGQSIARNLEEQQPEKPAVEFGELEIVKF